MTDPSALPADAVLVHIGPPKTGTTSIQATLAACRELLAEQGVAYPGTAIAHHRPARALRQHRTGWQDDGTPAPDPKHWAELAAQVQDVPGRVVVSSEFLADADASQRAQLLRDLGPDRVHVVVTVRNPGPLAVSMWQQVLKEGYTVSLEDWLQSNFRREADSKPNGFWVRADPGVLVGRWVETVGADRVTVIALDEADRELLPATFEKLLGLPDRLLVDRVPNRTNRGLTQTEAGLLHELNTAVQGRLSWREYNRFVRNGVVHRILTVRKPGPEEPKPVLPGWAAEQAAAEGARGAEALQTSGVRVVGSLAAFRSPRLGSGGAAEPAGVPLDLAAEALIGAVAAGARGRWHLDDDAGPTGSRMVTEVPTRELASIVANRVRASVRRRGRSLLSRRPD